jgi:acyl-CoA synthetase (AMP-forming)/AMP-acid ligase II
VPINNFLKPDELNYILQDAGIDVLITDEELAVHAPALLAARPQLKIFLVEEFHSEFGIRSSEFGTGSRSEQDLAVIIYTSGTTGRPKGAMLSHGNLLHNVKSCRIVLETVQADRLAVVLPLFHSYMLTVGIFLPLIVGGTMVLVNGINVYPREIEEIIYQYPGVKEAAVIGVPDPRKGEQPVAYVAAAEGQTLDENAILQHIRNKLADYKVPKKVIFMAALPRNATGKILKTTLRQQALV